MTLACTTRALIALVAAAGAANATQDWPSWRGPHQDGTTHERGLPASIAVEDAAWSIPLRGRGTPVVFGGRLYALGYDGEGAELQEHLICLDAETGALLWEDVWSDYLTDVIYDRYAIGSPTVDPETGDVYVLTTAGLLRNYSAEGVLRWERSCMEELGRLSFPNGRTGAPLIDGERVIVHIINSDWGPHGPANDRFYGLDKTTGEVLWSCTPGRGPKDSSFCMPVLDWEDGRRVLYSGTGCGNLVAIDARTGDPLWRFKMSIGGINSAPLVYGDSILAVHGKENMDTSTAGRMVRIERGHAPGEGESGPVELGATHERWRADLVAFTSSPVLVGARIYQTVANGELYCVDADNGQIVWHERLAADQIHASPVWGDGRLYVPMNDGSLHVLRASGDEHELLSTTQLEGNCLGAPSIAGGRVYVHTTERLYCFEGPAAQSGGDPLAAVARLQVVPAEILARPGDALRVRVRGLDEFGAVVHEDLYGADWSAAPSLQLDVDADGRLAVATDAPFAVGGLTATLGSLSASARVRVVVGEDYAENFDGIALSRTSATEAGRASGPPPSFWLGAGPKWEVLELDGEQVLGKRLDNPLFQRSFGFFGHPDMSGYTMQVDIMSDGNRRSMSSAGLMVQRYLIQLKGNHQQLEVSSNMERIKEPVQFRWRPGQWIRLKARVDLAPDGSGVVRAKAWPRDEPEPEEWTIEVAHADAHQSGAPGYFGITPQSRFRVYLDNLSVTSGD